MGIFEGLFGSPEPRDPIERALVARARGRASAEWLAGEMRTAELVVLLEGDGSAVAAGGRFHPLSVSTPSGYPVVCAFTSSARAGVMHERYRAWRTELVVGFAWLVAALPEGHGIAVNPGHDACAFFAPDEVGSLRGESAVEQDRVA